MPTLWFVVSTLSTLVPPEVSKLNAEDESVWGLKVADDPVPLKVKVVAPAEVVEEVQSLPELYPTVSWGDVVVKIANVEFWLMAPLKVTVPLNVVAPVKVFVLVPLWVYPPVVVIPATPVSAPEVETLSALEASWNVPVAFPMAVFDPAADASVAFPVCERPLFNVVAPDTPSVLLKVAAPLTPKVPPKLVAPVPTVNVFAPETLVLPFKVFAPLEVLNVPVEAE